MFKKTIPYIVSVLLSLCVGGFSALITMDNMSVYSEIALPSFAPPSEVFPIVWSILYVLMGIAAALAFKKGGAKSLPALYIYGLQLVLNFCWPIIFFNFRAFFISLIWLILLLAAVVITTVMFGKISKKAGYLMIPYVLWVAFAGVLNAAIWILNR